MTRRRGIALALVWVIAFALVGCAQPIAKVAEKTAQEQKAVCQSKMTLMQTEMKLFNADSGLEAPFETVIEKTNSVCPSGGTYTYDPATYLVTCSVHGNP